APLHDSLRRVQVELESVRRTADAGALAAVKATMTTLAPSCANPVAVDLRLDATIALPDTVVREAERAALLLARTCAFPYRTSASRASRQRFYERYGIGSMVPVLQAVDSDSGVGFPEDYPGMPAARKASLSRRDHVLLAAAQSAALDGRVEIELTESLIETFD